MFPPDEFPKGEFQGQKLLVLGGFMQFLILKDKVSSKMEMYESVHLSISSPTSNAIRFLIFFNSVWASQVALVVKNLPANAGDIRDMGWIPGSGRSREGGHGNPFQYSFFFLTHSSILAWRIPWTEDPGRLQSSITKS